MCVCALVDFTESQKHRLAKIGRDLWRPSRPIPLLRAGLATAACPVLHPFRFWITPRMEIPQSPLGNLLQRLTTLRVKRFLSMSKWKLLQFVPTVLSCRWISLRRVWLRLLYCLPIRYLINTLITSPWTFSTSGWTVPALSASPQTLDVSVP